MKLLVTLMILLGGQFGASSPGDPSTLVSSNDYARWNKDYPQTSFDLLASFTYPFPGSGKKLSDRKIIAPAAVQKLDKQKVGVHGYMLPLDVDGTGVLQFMLVRDLQTCCFGIHGDPNTFIFVTMTKRTSMSLFRPVTVYGTFHIGEVASGPNVEDIESYYRLDGSAIAIHTEQFDRATGGLQ